MDNRLTPEASRWKHRFYLLAMACLVATVSMSFPPIRAVVAYPLVAHDEQAAGDVAYVMADGPAYWERLRAASDLFHWDRVDRILILQEERSDGYNFQLERSQSRLERSISYLNLHGVSTDSISSIPENKTARFGSLSEAQGVAEHFPDLKSVVVVTSAPHTRRSKLCFQRAYAGRPTTVQVYSASQAQSSAEIYSPLWIEYAKLLVYFFAA